jgi:hypothetical protein
VVGLNIHHTGLRKGCTLRYAIERNCESPVEIDQPYTGAAITLLDRTDQVRGKGCQKFSHMPRLGFK